MQASHPLFDRRRGMHRLRAVPAKRPCGGHRRSQERTPRHRSREMHQMRNLPGGVQVRRSGGGVERREERSSLTIDGQKVEAMGGSSILEAARENGIEIPTLCYHEALEPYGSCRLCVVELETPRGPALVASCVYPAEDGAVVKTNSEMVQASRRMTAELLLAAAPHAKAIKELAARMGVQEPRVSLSDND